jgi:hypothetical protein
MTLDCSIDLEELPPGGSGFSMQLLWQPAANDPSAVVLRTGSVEHHKMVIPLQKSVVVPQNPNSLQHVFSGHVVPGVLAYLPHSATASQFETHLEPQ